VLVQPITPKRSFIDSYLGANQEPDEGFAKAIFRILKKEITT